MRKMRGWIGLGMLVFWTGCAKQMLVQPVIDTTRFHRLAVLPFATDSFISTVGAQMADEIVIRLVEKAKNLEIVERARIDSVLEEQRLSQQGVVSAETAVQVGRLLGVQALVTGSVSISIGDIRPTPLSPQRVATGIATVRVVDTETGKILWADRKESEYSIFLENSSDRNSLGYKTDNELAQNVIRDLASEIAMAFYTHYELGY